MTRTRLPFGLLEVKLREIQTLTFKQKIGYELHPLFGSYRNTENSTMFTPNIYPKIIDQ